VIPVLAMLVLFPGLPELPASWELGVFALDAETGEVLIDINGTVPFRPASTVKAVTTLAALEHLGAAYLYNTSIAADTSSGSLYLIGSGAPLLSAEDVTRTAIETAAALPGRNGWNLFLDPSAIASETHLPGWDESDWDRTYCPPVEPLCIGDNVLEIVVSAVDGPLRVYTYPPLPSLVVNTGQLRTGSSTSITATGGNWETGSPELTLSGTIEAGTREIIYKPFAGAPLELALYLEGELNRYGVPAVFGGVRLEEGGASVPGVTSTMYSDPLWVILGTMNKWSRNMVAEQVLRTVAFHVTGEPGSTRAGCDVSGALLDSICPGIQGWQLADGSGLSRLNMLAPEQLARVFLEGWSSLSYGPEFMASFPASGTDGTLAARMNGIPPGAFRGKTGSLNDTCTIAGILTTENGRKVALAVFIQMPRGHIWRARSWQDGYIEELYRSL